MLLCHSNYEISEESKQVRERQEKALQNLLLKRRAVPTNDKSVRDRLGEPITLFGEQEMERRARLDFDGQLDKLLVVKAHEVDDEIPEYPFFTEGPKELREARIDIAKYSIRIQRAKRRRDDPDEDMDAETKINMVLACSNIGDDRPLTGCSLSRDGKILATCSLSGVTKLWEMPQVTNNIAVLKDHRERATDVVFSPVDELQSCGKVMEHCYTLLKVIWIVLHASLSTHQGSTSEQQAMTKHGDCGMLTQEQSCFCKKVTVAMSMDLRFNKMEH